MTAYEIFVFCLCLVVYVLLIGLFVVLFTCIVRLSIRLIKSGADDEKILAEYRKEQKTKAKIKTGWIETLFTVVFCCVCFFSFGFSVYLSINEDKVATIPVYRVVLSDSMAKKYERNTHLFNNDLNDQFQRFDLILTHKLPEEEDLKLYDIVVYEVDDVLVVHRIVGIEEPNEEHPNQRYFLLQGDAVAAKDKFPVLYSQMKAIYRGEKIPCIGSVIAFLQSPAGYIAILILLLSVVTIPLMEDKIEKEKRVRLKLILKEEEEE